MCLPRVFSPACSLCSRRSSLIEPFPPPDERKAGAESSKKQNARMARAVCFIQRVLSCSYCSARFRFSSALPPLCGGIEANYVEHGAAFYCAQAARFPALSRQTELLFRRMVGSTTRACILLSRSVLPSCEASPPGVRSVALKTELCVTYRKVIINDRGMS